MKILFDTNVILDVLLHRKPHCEIAARLINRVESGQLEGYLSAHSLTTVGYLVTKAHDRARAKTVVKNLLTLFQIADVNQIVLGLAIDLPFSDLEDAVLYQAGLSAGVDAVVTRNGRDFKKVQLPIYSPQELYGLLQQKQVDHG